MLIYTANKEFIGIDEKDLKSLGFKSFLDLRSEVADFADLFVKTPGHIHNFKHVHWIDFLSYADSSEEAQVIINANNKNFKAKVTVENFFLAQNPSLNSYVVTLHQLRELTKKESENISGDISSRAAIERAVQLEAPQEVDAFDPPHVQARTPIDPYEAPLDVDFDFEEVPAVAPAKEIVAEPKATLDDMLDVGDLSFDEPQTPLKAESVQKVVVQNEIFENGYVYDPQVASHELGLPLDLIEEFIEDFITQAKEFKEEIYAALDASEFDKVKILSHKLKGVAANLRIEDAFGALTLVNASNEINVIKENLDTFYRITAKLAGEEIAVEKVLASTPLQDETEEEIELDFKEDAKYSLEQSSSKVVAEEEAEDDLYGDLLHVEDSEVPQKIEIAELADDEFTSLDVDLSDVEKELEEMEIFELDEEPLLDLAQDALVDELLDIEEEMIPELHYSKESVAAEIGIDIESFVELLEDYMSESHEIIKNIKESAQMDDFKNCAHEAMKLQGMSDNMRIKEMDGELEAVIGATNKEDIIKAIQRVERMILQISRAGV